MVLPPVTVSGDRAAALFREADRLVERARDVRAEAEALDRAARRLHAMAAAIADGRDDEIAEIALDIGS